MSSVIDNQPLIRSMSVDQNGKKFYSRSQGYGQIDTWAKEFQLGRRLYDAQIIIAKVEKEMSVTPEETKMLAEHYCELVNAVGLLRGDYRAMVEVANGKAELKD